MVKARASVNKTALDVLKTTKKTGGTPVQVGPVRARASRSRSRTPGRLQSESTSGDAVETVKRSRGRPKSSPKVKKAPTPKRSTPVASTKSKKPAKKETKPKSKAAKSTKRVGKPPTAADKKSAAKKKERTTPSRSTAAKAEQKSTPSAPASARKTSSRTRRSSGSGNSNSVGTSTRYATRAKVAIIEDSTSSIQGSKSNVSVSSRGSASGGGWFSRCNIV